MTDADRRRARELVKGDETCLHYLNHAPRIGDWCDGENTCKTCGMCEYRHVIRILLEEVERLEEKANPALATLCPVCGGMKEPERPTCGSATCAGRQGRQKER